MQPLSLFYQFRQSFSPRWSGLGFFLMNLLQGNEWKEERALKECMIQTPWKWPRNRDQGLCAELFPELLFPENLPVGANTGFHSLCALILQFSGVKLLGIVVGSPSESKHCWSDPIRWKKFLLSSHVWATRNEIFENSGSFNNQCKPWQSISLLLPLLSSNQVLWLSETATPQWSLK